ncbi:MAG: 2'-5' RNA ligase family protein [Opitutales bacterium]|nr:2'-5' RNA ligase family protein [Opitutales bacterium]
MPYSLEVHFDDVTNAMIQNMWKKISENKIPCRAFDKNFTPHLTLVYGEISGPKKVNWEFLEGQKKFEITFENLAIFEDRGLVFLSPEKSKPLSKLHSLHDANAGFSSMNKFYRTAKWDPHCSLASRLTPKQVQRCASLFNDFKLPFQATCVSSHLVKYPDPVILSSFEYKAE